MAHSFNSCLMHCVFSTKERRPLIPPPLRERLWPFLGGIARQNGIKAIEIGGVQDHVHVLLSLPAVSAVTGNGVWRREMRDCERSYETVVSGLAFFYGRGK